MALEAYYCKNKYFDQKAEFQTKQLFTVRLSMQAPNIVNLIKLSSNNIIRLIY